MTYVGGRGTSGDSSLVAFYVRVVPTIGDRTAVLVTPRVWTGYPPRGYVIDDADYEPPGYVTARADVLWLEIHDYEMHQLYESDPCRASPSRS